MKEEQVELETFNSTPEQDTREQLDGELWLVDYDLDVCNGRRQFYRNLKRFRKKHGMPQSRSSQSVIITTDPNYASYVYEQANHYGTAHLYQATRIR